MQPQLYSTYLPFRECWVYTCIKLLKKELQEFVQYWNSHLIRRNRIADCPAGVPDDMFEMPSTFGELHAIKKVLL